MNMRYRLYSRKPYFCRNLYYMYFKYRTPGFKPWPGYVRRVFHLSLRLITFRVRSAHLVYLVHKGGRKTYISTSTSSSIMHCNHLLSRHNHFTAIQNDLTFSHIGKVFYFWSQPSISCVIYSNLKKPY